MDAAGPAQGHIILGSSGCIVKRDVLASYGALSSFSGEQKGKDEYTQGPERGNASSPFSEVSREDDL